MGVGLIYQPCGLGDILFLQKLAHTMKAEGYEVWWPVVSEFKWLRDHIFNYNFVSWDDDHSPKENPPLADSVEFPRKDFYWPHNGNFKDDELWFFQGFEPYEPIMAGKYESQGIDWTDWSQYIQFARHPEAEDRLFSGVLGLSEGEDYVVVNRNYRTRPNREIYEAISINPKDYGCRVVEMGVTPGFTLFDWCKVFEHCKEVNMIETSVNYLLESPALFDTMKEKRLQLHSSKGYFGEVAYLFNLPWEYVRD